MKKQKPLYGVPLLAGALLCFAGCRQEVCPEASWSNTPELRGAHHLTVDPLLTERTRATATEFERGDRIGVSVTTSEGDYLDNTPLTFNGTLFADENVRWYDDGQQRATVTAYYPYQATGRPEEFSVAADQSSGLSSSDLLVAARLNVQPTESPLDMLFDHMLSKIRITVDTPVESLLLEGSLGTAAVSYETTSVTAVPGTAIVITPHALQAGTEYEAIVVPQSVSLSVTITVDGKSSQSRRETKTLEAGKYYTLAVSYKPGEAPSLTFQGSINDWQPGGAIGEAEDEETSPGPDEGKDNKGELQNPVLEGVTYRCARLEDGRVWMTENLRYRPAGQSGIWEPSQDAGEEEVERYGLLYSAAAALGVEQVTAERAEALEGARGLCPEGWHIPTREEFTALIRAYGASGMPEEFRQETEHLYNGTSGSYTTSNRCYIWTSTADLTSGTPLKYYRYEASQSAEATTGSSAAVNGLSVRCIQD